MNVVPWIVEPGSGDGWGRYGWERRWIADRIRALELVDRLLMLSGDGHMVAIDDGTNSNFATDSRPGERGFPVVHAAPFDRYPRSKGGGPTVMASTSRSPSSVSRRCNSSASWRCGTTGTFSKWSCPAGIHAAGSLPGMRIELRCGGDGCVPFS